MKVLYDDIIYSLQKWGGISVYWNELHDRLKKFNIHFYELKINSKKITLFAKKNNFKKIKNKNLYLFFERYINPHPLINEKHIFHSSYYRISKNVKSLNVVTVHDFTYETHVKGFRKWIHVFQKRRALKKADGIICISEFSKNTMLNLYPFTRNKIIEVIYHGISDDFFKKKIVYNLNVKSNVKKTYLIYIGDRKAKYKNFKLTTEIVRSIGIQLVIIGGGKLSKLEKKILSDVDYVNFEYLKVSQLSHLMRRAHCLLYPSVSEGFGIPILEAQISFCPVVSTNRTCIPEISGGHAILVDDIKCENFVSAINKLYDKRLRKNLIEKGYNNSLKYSWDKTAELTFDFYKKLIN